MKTYLLLELWIATGEFIIDVTREILEPAVRKSSKLLARLVALGMEVIANREERN